jgi:hypothetical protein
MVTQPNQLKWWQWIQILGVTLPILLVYAGVEHPLMWAIALHFFMDFTAQSNETSVGKRQNSTRVLLYHAFISGGYAGLIVGGLLGLVISTIAHFLIDSTNKFGLSGVAGVILDQAAHIATLIIIWLLL